MSGESPWKTAHTILLVIAFAVVSTVGAISFFASAAEFKEFKNDVHVYQLEDQAGKVQDRVIALEKDISRTTKGSEKAEKTAEKHKWEMQLDYLNKKIEYYQTKGGK